MDRQSCMALMAGASLGAAACYLATSYYNRTYCPTTPIDKSCKAIDIQASSGAQDTWRPLDASTHSTQCATTNASVHRFEDDEILSEQLTRNVQFFGLENQKKIANSFVVVVGLGVRLDARTHACIYVPIHNRVPSTSSCCNT